MGAPKVRLHDMDVVEVWTGGEWQQAEVEDFRTLAIEFDFNFQLAVTEEPLPPGCEDHSCVYPDECEGYTCDDCGWDCEDGIHGVAF